PRQPPAARESSGGGRAGESAAVFASRPASGGRIPPADRRSSSATSWGRQNRSGTPGTRSRCRSVARRRDAGLKGGRARSWAVAVEGTTPNHTPTGWTACGQRAALIREPLAKFGDRVFFHAWLIARNRVPPRRS